MAQYGDILNKHQVIDVKSGPVKASTTLGIGLVYEEGSNGWRNAPTNGSIKGSTMYFNPVSIDNSSGSKGDKICTVYGLGTKFVGKADGAIAVDQRCKPSTNHAGDLEALADVTVGDPGDTSTVDLGAQIAALIQAVYTYIDDIAVIYRGKVQTGTESGVSRAAAADTDTDCVFEIVRI